MEKTKVEKMLKNTKNLRMKYTNERFREALLRKLKQQELRVESEKAKETFRLLERCTHHEIELHFIGKVKAGKSSLINALLGGNYASSDVTPETATISRFRRGKCDRIEVAFYSKEEWRALLQDVKENWSEVKKVFPNFDEIVQHSDSYIGMPCKVFNCKGKQELIENAKKWTSSQNPEHFFVKKIDLESSSIELPENVIIVDTPGLDDILHYRSKITKDYMMRADYIFHCRGANEAFTESDMKRIKQEYQMIWNRKNIYVVGNKYDTLNYPQKDGERMKQEWCKHLSMQDLCGSKKEAEQKIIFTSSYMHKLLSEKMDDEKKFEVGQYVFKFLHEMPNFENGDSQKERLLDFAGIERLKRLIWNTDMYAVMLRRLKYAKSLFMEDCL